MLNSSASGLPIYSGFLKSFAITIDELEDAITEGVRFDGSTLHGFIRSDEREMIALPDVSTFKILPWRPKEDSVARMICDIHQMDMTPYEGDSRYILKKNLKKAAAKGIHLLHRARDRVFLFKNSVAAGDTRPRRLLRPHARWTSRPITGGTRC